MVVQPNGHVVVMRWQALVKGGGRGWAAVQGSSKERVMGVLVQHLVVSTGRSWGRGEGGMRGEELGEGRVVN